MLDKSLIMANLREAYKILIEKFLAGGGLNLAVSTDALKLPPDWQYAVPSSKLIL